MYTIGMQTVCIYIYTTNDMPRGLCDSNDDLWAFVVHILFLFFPVIYFYFTMRHLKYFGFVPKRVFAWDEDNTTPLYSSPCLYRFSYTYSIPQGTLIEKCNFIGDWSKNKMFTWRFVCKTRVSCPFVQSHIICAKTVTRVRYFRFSFSTRIYTHVHSTVGFPEEIVFNLSKCKSVFNTQRSYYNIVEHSLTCGQLLLLFLFFVTMTWNVLFSSATAPKTRTMSPVKLYSFVHIRVI